MYSLSDCNSDSIFLPAADYRYNDDLYRAGSSGSCWSSSLRTKYPSSACRVYFSSGYVDTNGSGRYNGQSVRPVLE